MVDIAGLDDAVALSVCCVSYRNYKAFRNQFSEIG